jgi:VanZ family protein
MHIARFFVLAFWGALLFAVTMGLLPAPPQLPGEPSDKVQHILAFAVLTALAVAAYPQLRLIWIGVGLSLVGAAIELLQLIPSLNREGDLVDWLADCAAVVVVLLFARWWKILAGRRKPERLAPDPIQPH